MNVKELKQQLDYYPDNMEVMIKQTDTEFSLSLLNSITPKNATFSDGDLKAKDKVLILSDEF